MTRTHRLNFTKAALAALTPPARTTFFDTKTRGLVILATSGGANSVYVRRKVGGRSERIYIGRSQEWTVERARARADEITAGIGRGENPAQLRRARRTEMTLDDLFTEYVSRNVPCVFRRS